MWFPQNFCNLKLENAATLIIINDNADDHYRLTVQWFKVKAIFVPCAFTKDGGY